MLRLPRLAALVVVLLGAAGCGPATSGDDPSGTTPSSPIGSVTGTEPTVPPSVTTPTGPTDEPAEPVRIGLVVHGSGASFGQTVVDSVSAEVDAAGADLVRCDPGQDNELLPDCLQRMVTQQVDGWILVPTGSPVDLPCTTAGRADLDPAPGAADTSGVDTDSTADTDSTDSTDSTPDDRAGEAASPGAVVLLTVGDSTDCTPVVVGPDDRDSGHLVGEQLGRQAKERYNCRPDVVAILSTAGDPAGAARREGVVQGYLTQCPQAFDHLATPAGTADPDASDPSTPHPGTTDRTPGSGTETATPTELLDLQVDGQEQAWAALTGALVGLPEDATVVVAATDEATSLGAWAALPEQTEQPEQPDPTEQPEPTVQPERTVLAGVGAGPGVRCHIRNDQRWIGDAALFPERYGSVVVPALLAAVDGRPVSATPLPSRFLTAAALDEMYPEDQCPTS